MGLKAIRTDHYPDAENYNNICYWKNDQGYYMIYFPEGHLGQLQKHKIIEHEDNTITVSPSILLRTPPIKERHGFLKHGIWQDC